MRWGLDNPNAREEIDAYQRFNQPLPDALIAPELHDEFELGIYRAFFELSAEREQGAAINWHSIQRYATFMGVEPTILNQLIRLMDDAYLAHKSGASKKFSREMMRK